MSKVPLIDKLEALTRNEAFREDWKWYKEKIQDPLFSFRGPLIPDRRRQDEDRIARLKAVLGDLLPDPWVRLAKLKKLATPPKSRVSITDAVRVCFWDEENIRLLKSKKWVRLEINLTAVTRTELLDEVGEIIDEYRKIIGFRDRENGKRWAKKSKQGFPSKWEVFDKAKQSVSLLSVVKTITGIDADSNQNDELKRQYVRAQTQWKEAKTLIESSYPSRSSRS